MMRNLDYLDRDDPEALVDEIANLQRQLRDSDGEDPNAARYRFIRDNYTQSHSLQMDGTSGFRFRTMGGRARTFDELVDATMAEASTCRPTPSR